MRVLFLLLLLQVPSHPHESETPVRLVFLSQDTAHGYDHAGLTPTMLDPLRLYVRQSRPDIYVGYDLRKLRAHNVPMYYIYHRKYLPPIGKVLSANLFVMSRVVLTKTGRPPSGWADDTYDVEAKAYSSVTGREHVILTRRGVQTSELQGLVRGREAQLLALILQVAQREGP